MFGIKKPFDASCAQRFIIVLFVTPSCLLISIGVNSKVCVFTRYANKAFSFASKAIMPSKEECDNNPRARSAKLRYAIKKKGFINE